MKKIIINEKQYKKLLIEFANDKKKFEDSAKTFFPLIVVHMAMIEYGKRIGTEYYKEPILHWKKELAGFLYQSTEGEMKCGDLKSLKKWVYNAIMQEYPNFDKLFKSLKTKIKKENQIRDLSLFYSICKEIYDDKFNSIIDVISSKNVDIMRDY